MISKSKLRQERHQKMMGRKQLLKKSKQFANKYNVKLNADGSYTPRKLERPTGILKIKHPYRRQTPHYPSHSSGVGVGTKTDSNIYTGTSMRGIATMHKSNSVPVFDAQHAKDLARMRR
jgi:hypothetical protein